jgi:glycerol-3-phosphate acyltransferase PlsX
MEVVVCDGFVGNIIMKMSEGRAFSLLRMLKRELFSGLVTRLGTWLSKPAFKRFISVVDYAEYGGAPLLGLQGICIVCHGKSNARAITNAVKRAAAFVEKDTNGRLRESIITNEELTRFSRAL